MMKIKWSALFSAKIVFGHFFSPIEIEDMLYLMTPIPSGIILLNASFILLRLDSFVFSFTWKHPCSSGMVAPPGFSAFRNPVQLLHLRKELVRGHGLQ